MDLREAVRVIGQLQARVAALEARIPPRLLISPGLPRGRIVFPVDLTQTGGSNGNKTTAATWTYTVNDLDGNELGTAVSPLKVRPNGTMTAATKGIAYYDEDGNLVLYDTNERYGTGGC